MTETMAMVGRHLENIKKDRSAIAALLLGKTIRITAPFWCDQPIGTSRPNQSGKHFKIREVYLGGGEPYLSIGDFRCSIRLKDVEVID